MFSQGASFSQSSLFKLSPDVFVRKNPDGSIIVMSTTSEEDKFFRITGVAADIFDKIDGQTPIAKIVENVKSQYEVKVEKIAADAEPFLEKLIKFNIVTVA